MINHARSLLLNRDGSLTGFTGRAGDEFVPPDFREIKRLPGYIVGPRRVLFGQSPDWLFANYRTRQYMGVLHSTELVEFVERLDPRITYEANNPDLFQRTFVTSANAADIRFVGTPPAPDESGQSFKRWRLQVIDSGTVRLTPLMPDGPFVNRPFTSEGNWSSLVPLGSDRFFVSFAPDIGRQWTVEQKLRPQRSLGEIVANLEQLTAPYWNDLFDFGSAAEPMQTFRNLWNLHPQLPYRLGGFLLAVIYKTEERRTSA